MKIKKTRNQEVIAAIKLDRQSLKIAKAAAVLAARAGKDLRLVHVFEPEIAVPPTIDRDWFESYHGMAPGIYDERSFLFYAPDSYNELATDVRAADYFERAEADICGVAAQLSYFDIPIHTSVLVGNYPASILELSASHCGSLLVAGAEKKETGMFQLRLRDTFRLMAGSDLPVLIIPDSLEELDLGSDRPIRILVADDLSEHSLDAIRCLSDIIRNFNLLTNVLHNHVETLNTAALSLSPAFELVLWPGIEIKDRMINERHAFIKTRMINRSTGLRSSVESAGGEYHLELWHGNVANELKRASEVHKADITVFGKHHMFHSHPFSVGQMGYKKMMALDSAILVAPELGKEAHA